MVLTEEQLEELREDVRKTEKWLKYYQNGPAVIERKDEMLPEEVLQENGLHLNNINVVTRHGDREPVEWVDGVGKLVSNPFMIPNSDIEIPDWMKDTYNEYKRFADFYAVSHHTPCYQYTLRPYDVLLARGELTVIGALQHIALGRALREAYDKYFSKIEINSATTPVARTLQSGFAFLYGFIKPPNKPTNDYYEHYPAPQLRDDIFLSKSSEDHMATSLLAKHLTVKCDHEYNELMMKDDAKKLIEKIDDFVDLNQSKHEKKTSKKKFEKGMTYYTLLLDGCFTFLLHDAVTPPDDPANVPKPYEVYRYCRAMTRCADIIYKDPGYEALKWLQMGEFLQEICEKIAVVDGKSISLNHFSAHEHNIDAIKVALGYRISEKGILRSPTNDQIPREGSETRLENDRPPYASCIAIESYHQDATGKIYLRIMYNGKDITKNTSFCDGQVVSKEDFIVLTGSDNNEYYLIDFRRFKQDIYANLEMFKGEVKNYKKFNQYLSLDNRF